MIFLDINDIYENSGVEIIGITPYLGECEEEITLYLKQPQMQIGQSGLKDNKIMI